MPTALDNFYLQQKPALLKNHARLMANGLSLLHDRYGAVMTQAVVAETRLEFEQLIPQIPYIGGSTNPLTDTLVQMTSLLALYRVLSRREIAVEDIGSLVQQMAQAQIDRFPWLVRKLIGRLYMTRFWRQRTARLAQASQQREFPGNFVYEVVEGNGEAYQWGINYLECGVVKFFHQQEADEFSPYMCLIDYLMFPGMGLDLKRQGTIANGCTHCDFRFSHPPDKQ